MPFRMADGHVETLGATWMMQNRVTDAFLWHNHPSGTCGNCDYFLPSFLQEGSTMTVIPPSDAVPRTPRWVGVPKTYTGNARRLK